jgi:hypothetical protein
VAAEEGVYPTGFCFNGKHAHEIRTKIEQSGGASSDSNLSCESTPRKHASDLPSRSRMPRESAILPWRVKREQEREQVLRRMQRDGGSRRQGDASRPAGRNAARKQSAKEEDSSNPSDAQKMAAARWAEAQARWDKRYEELVAFREKNGYNFETMACSDKMAYGCELYWWTQNQRQVYKNGPRRRPLPPHLSSVAPASPRHTPYGVFANA